jgi:hypothetical protein
VAKRCPLCAQRYEGNPRNCPNCGRQIPDYDPTRCEFCGTKVKPGQDNCPNCGAPVEHCQEAQPQQKAAEAFGGDFDSADSTVTVTRETVVTVPAASKSTSCGIKALVFVIVAAAVLPVLLGVAIPALISYSERQKLSGDTPEERGAVITPALLPDSIYRATIVEGENTIETIWPRVMTDLPDSVAWVNDYSPAVAFSFTTSGEHSLIQLDASAPIDLVMSLLRLNSDGSMTFIRFNDDSDIGRDPSIVDAVPAGDYLAIVNNLGGYEYGEVRFVWQVLQPEVPLLVPDTTFTIALSDRNRLAYFYVEITADSSYVFEASSESIDSYIELHTEGGSVLSNDDGGTGANWNDARLTFDATALQAGEACLIVRPYYYSSSNTWGDVLVRFVEGEEPGKQ